MNNMIMTSLGNGFIMAGGVYAICIVMANLGDWLKGPK